MREKTDGEDVRTHPPKNDRFGAIGKEPSGKDHRKWRQHGMTGAVWLRRDRGKEK
jgi:hypothetical protein